MYRAIKPIECPVAGWLLVQDPMLPVSNPKRPTVPAQTAVPKEHRPTGLDQHREGADGKQRSGEEQQQSGGHHIRRVPRSIGHRRHRQPRRWRAAMASRPKMPASMNPTPSPKVFRGQTGL